MKEMSSSKGQVDAIAYHIKGQGDPAIALGSVIEFNPGEYKLDTLVPVNEWAMCCLVPPPPKGTECNPNKK